MRRELCIKSNVPPILSFVPSPKKPYLWGRQGERVAFGGSLFRFQDVTGLRTGKTVSIAENSRPIPGDVFPPSRIFLKTFVNDKSKEKLH